MNSVNRGAYLALLALCIIWGTTFLAARIGVKAFPPLLFMGARHSIAGLLLLGFCVIKNKSLPRWADIKKQVLPGIMLVALGNGIVGLAVKHIPSGLAALICAMMPVYVVVINLINKRNEPMNYKIVSGLLLGLAGLLVIFKDNLQFLGNPQYLGGIVLCLVSCLFWALGSIYSKRQQSTAGVFVNVGLQLLTGGLVLVLSSPVFENWKDIHGVPAATIGAITYLILFGSIGAFVCYHYVLSKLPVGLATLYAYVNPLVAIVLGYFILNEPITGYTVLAFLLTITGIFLVNAGYRHKPSPKVNIEKTQFKPA
jgi:drug/metabolite transporter (DMT)-like permease